MNLLKLLKLPALCKTSCYAPFTKPFHVRPGSPPFYAPMQLDRMRNYSPSSSSHFLQGVKLRITVRPSLPSKPLPPPPLGSVVTVLERWSRDLRFAPLPSCSAEAGTEEPCSDPCSSVLPAPAPSSALLLRSEAGFSWAQ